MHLILINPNTTQSMTESMATAARQIVGGNVSITALTSQYGPESIEGYYDEAFAIPPMIERILEEKDKCDGVVVGCFDDTGVDALRCVLDVPVVGICQAAMITASMVSGSFSVITTLSRSVPCLEMLALKYGFKEQCRRIRASEVPVLELEKSAGTALEAIEQQVEAAIEEDRAEAIVLGCAGMVDLSKKLSEKYGLPVIEGVTAAIKFVESLHILGINSSKIGGYASPRQKQYLGEFKRFSPRQVT